MYQVFNTYDDALAFSEQAGIDAGLAYHQGDDNGTRYMYSIITHTDGRAACYVDELVDGMTKEQLEADGWFPEPQEIL